MDFDMQNDASRPDAIDVTREPADWNVVITLQDRESFGPARQFLGKWGRVRRTHFYNVMTLTVDDVSAFLPEFAAAVVKEPGILNDVSHLMPAHATFDFATAEDFEQRARDIALGWAGRLANQRFHVRLHRRGFKGTLSTPHEERFLDNSLLQALAQSNAPGRVGFDDPDAILCIETIDGRAGMSMWTRDDLKRFAFLGLM